MRKILYILLLSLVLAAVDSEDKRRAAIGIPPIPNSEISAEDRMHIAGYSRYEASGEIEDDPETGFWRFWRWGGWWD